MPIQFQIYTAAWLVLCSLSIALCVRSPAKYVFLKKQYWVFLVKRWKVVTFVIAAALMTFLAPLSGDVTWDYYDALFMSALTYATAPWVIGIFYGLWKRKSGSSQVFVAFCVWMFSASWSYDIYIFLRDGFYPPTWWSNIGASSVLYFSAGLMWNLDWSEQRSVHFAFTEEGWPLVTKTAVFWKVFLWVLPFMLLVTAALGWLIYLFHS